MKNETEVRTERKAIVRAILEAQVRNLPTEELEAELSAHIRANPPNLEDAAKRIGLHGEWQTKPGQPKTEDTNKEK